MLPSLSTPVFTIFVISSESKTGLTTRAVPRDMYPPRKDQSAARLASAPSSCALRLVILP